MDPVLKTRPNIDSVLSLEIARDWAGLEAGDTSHDSNLMRDAAREHIQNLTNCAIGQQTWIVYRDSFPADGVIELPYPPLIEVVSIKYRDTSGTLQTMPTSDYDVAFCGDERSRIHLADGVTPPSTKTHPQAVAIEFSCGFIRGASTGEMELPGPLDNAMRIFLEDAFDNRTGSEQSTKTIARLCKPYLTERYGEK